MLSSSICFTELDTQPDASLACCSSPAGVHGVVSRLLGFCGARQVTTESVRLLSPCSVAGKQRPSTWAVATKVRRRVGVSSFRPPPVPGHSLCGVGSACALRLLLLGSLLGAPHDEPGSPSRVLSSLPAAGEAAGCSLSVLNSCFSLGGSAA
jgi:hypothetical protein